MRGKRTMIIGFMAMMAITGVVNGPTSFAAEAGSVTSMVRIGHGGSTYGSSQPDGASDCRVTGAQQRVEVIERIGAGGSTYAVSKTAGCQTAGEERKQVNVIERIGAGGSTYSFSRQLMTKQ